MITYVSVSSEDELTGILELQKQNLAANLTPQQIDSQGFVTVVHNFDLLKKMNVIEPSIVAKDNGKVVGYCLAMTQDFSQEIPVLVPMFEKINDLVYKSTSLKGSRYMVVGQVCIAQNYRGKGILDSMYQAYKESFKNGYEFAGTEIASRNKRSLKAHQRIGFETVHTYHAPGGENWQIVLWDWS
jgi:predicted GNAT superfamily acetyltransferase